MCVTLAPTMVTTILRHCSLVYEQVDAGDKAPVDMFAAAKPDASALFSCMKFTAVSTMFPLYESTQPPTLTLLPTTGINIV